jgi:hypothetical protein
MNEQEKKERYKVINLEENIKNYEIMNYGK